MLWVEEDPLWDEIDEEFDLLVHVRRNLPILCSRYCPYITLWKSARALKSPRKCMLVSPFTFYAKCLFAFKSPRPTGVHSSSMRNTW